MCYLQVVPVDAEPLHLVPYTQHLLSLTVTHPFLHLRYLLMLITRDVNTIDTLFGIGDELSQITAVLPLTYAHSHAWCESKTKA